MSKKNNINNIILVKEKQKVKQKKKNSLKSNQIKKKINYSFKNTNSNSDIVPTKKSKKNIQNKSKKKIYLKGGGTYWQCSSNFPRCRADGYCYSLDYPQKLEFTNTGISLDKGEIDDSKFGVPDDARKYKFSNCTYHHFKYLLKDINPQIRGNIDLNQLKNILHPAILRINEYLSFDNTQIIKKMKFKEDDNSNLYKLDTSDPSDPSKNYFFTTVRQPFQDELGQKIQQFFTQLENIISSLPFNLQDYDDYQDIKTKITTCKYDCPEKNNLLTKIDENISKISSTIDELKELILPITQFFNDILECTTSAQLEALILEDKTDMLTHIQKITQKEEKDNFLYAIEDLINIIPDNLNQELTTNFVNHLNFIIYNITEIKSIINPIIILLYTKFANDNMLYELSEETLGELTPIYNEITKVCCDDGDCLEDFECINGQQNQCPQKPQNYTGTCIKKTII